MTSYPTHEIFSTFQGEGVYMGLPAFFIRTLRCPIRCPWCDAAGTWSPDWVPKDTETVAADKLADEAKASGAPIVVITGGEPTVYDLTDLVRECQSRGLRVHLETSGAFVIKGNPDWITLSPKKWKPPIQANLLRAHEFKIIVESAMDIELYARMIKMEMFHYSHVWLHPEWSKAKDPAVLKAIIDAVKAGKGCFRAGVQLHKHFKVDSFDERSRPLVPLGGDLARGY